MREVTVAATQIACSWDRDETLNKAEKIVRDAAAAGANVILLQELFETPYFCQTHKYEYLHLATKMKDNPAVRRFQKISEDRCGTPCCSADQFLRRQWQQCLQHNCHD